MRLRQKLKIKQKILFYTLSVTVLVFVASVSYIGLNSRSHIHNITTELAGSHTKEYANLARENLNGYVHAIRIVRHFFENHAQIPEENRRQVLSSNLRYVLEQNPEYLSVWSILHTASIDNRDSLHINQPGSTILGNFRYIYFRDNNRIMLSDYIEQNPDEVLSGYIYNQVKERMTETIIDPEYYSYTGDTETAVLQTSIVAPVAPQGQFMGVVGIDIPLAKLQEMIDSYRPVPGSFAFLLTQEGEVISFPDQNKVGESLTETGLLNEASEAVLENIRQGKPIDFNTRYMDEKAYYVTLEPVPIGNTGTSWFVGLAFPREVIMSTATRSMWVAFIVGIIGLLIIGLVIGYLADNITKPLKKLTQSIDDIALGKVDRKMMLSIDSGDEIAEMGVAINTYIDGYLSKSEFANQIGQGNLDASLTSLSEQDRLAQSLLHMRKSLQKAKEDEQIRKVEDEKRTWVNEGLNRFADILRQHNEKLEDLSFAIIKNLVVYLQANQGGIFLLNDTDQEVYYELKASYAYNRRKFLEKRFFPGEGLVGACAREGKTQYMTQIPQDYMEITSGLGDANPDCLLIVPLKQEKEVLGVLEIASFKKLEKYQIEFVEKVGESIASSLSSMKITMHTSELLEKSQQQAEEMRAQEEEMRQNMEELNATQEAMSEKDRDNQKTIAELRNKIEEKESQIQDLITKLKAKGA